MLRFIKNFHRTVYFLYILSKNQLLLNRYLPKYSQNRLPFLVSFFANLINLTLYPKAIFSKPKKSFGERLTDCFYELGPIYIKLGQTLSTRPDLIGEEIAESLKYLQDKLPPFDSAIVHEKIERELGKKTEELFSDFNDKPVAAASIAQVHKAKLKDGKQVAVKIVRPAIAEKYESDIEFLDFISNIISKLVKKTQRLKPQEVIKVFRKTMQFELDLRSEAAAASKIRDNFINDDSLIIPEIYWQMTSSDIITLEWVEGVSIYNREKIIEIGLDPKDIAAKIAIIFFNQAYRDGFFHADLHPGNIMVCKDGRIVLVDFGIVGFLPEDDRLAIAEILYAFLHKDYDLVASVHKRVGYIPKDTNLNDFAMSCRAIAEPIIGLAIKDISIGNLLRQLFQVTEQYGMETQPQLLLLQKTMVVVEGIGQSLDKNINMWQLSEPWIKKWAAKNLSPEAKGLRIINKLIEKLFN